MKFDYDDYLDEDNDDYFKNVRVKPRKQKKEYQEKVSKSNNIRRLRQAREKEKQYIESFSDEL